MRVFIETLQGTNIRTRYDEATFQIKETFRLSAPYPYAYGFIIGTNKRQEDCVDCFIVSDEKLIEGTEIDCEPIFMLEVHEGSEEDNKVIMKTSNYIVDDECFVENTIREFIHQIFSMDPNLVFSIGRKMGREETINYIGSKT